ncbi:MAG: asparagine synthase-related protein, partial [Campylobacter sp.]
YKMRLPELILQKIDYSTMSQSVEARSPFMDHFLIEYSSGLSFDTKMKYGAKSILKEIAKNKLPGYILNQPKVGFGMLLTPFLQNIMPIWYQKELLLKKAMIHEFISKIFLQKLLDGHTKYKNQGYKMWILFALEKWLEMNFDSKK